MPRNLAPIPPELTGPLPDLAQLLREIWQEAGRPNLRALAARGHCSASTLSNAMGGRRVPTWSTCQALLKGCDKSTEPYLTQVRDAFDQAVRFRADLRELEAARAMPVLVSPLPRRILPDPRRIRTLADLQRALNDVHAAAGKPSHRKLQAMAAVLNLRLPASTVGDLLKRKNPQVPKWNSVAIFLVVCDVPDAEFLYWKHSYEQVSLAMAAQRRIQPPPSARECAPDDGSNPTQVIDLRTGLPQRRTDPTYPWRSDDGQAPAMLAQRVSARVVMPGALRPPVGAPLPPKTWTRYASPHAMGSGENPPPTEDADRTCNASALEKVISVLSAGESRDDTGRPADASPSPVVAVTDRPAVRIARQSRERRQVSRTGHRYSWPDVPGSPGDTGPGRPASFDTPGPLTLLRSALQARRRRQADVIDHLARQVAPARVGRPRTVDHAVVSGRRHRPRHRVPESPVATAWDRVAYGNADRPIAWQDGGGWADLPEPGIPARPAVQLISVIVLLVAGLWLAPAYLVARAATTPQAAASVTPAAPESAGAHASSPVEIPAHLRPQRRGSTGVDAITKQLAPLRQANRHGLWVLGIMALLLAACLLADRQDEREAEDRMWNQMPSADTLQQPADVALRRAGPPPRARARWRSPQWAAP